MKYVIMVLLLVSIGLMIPDSAQAQKEHIFQKPSHLNSDSSKTQLYQLNANYPFTDSFIMDNLNPFPDYKPITGFKKTLFIIGTDLIRGGAEEYSIYSYKNSGNYPGPTVKYPQSITEQELFLERYQRYTSNN